MHLAERLGYGPEARLLVIHADDMGSCRAANAATFELMDSRAITSGSVIVPGPEFRAVAEYQRRNPSADIGVHLALNSEHPNLRWRGVLGPEATPSLHDADGYLPLTLAEVVARADPDEAARELRAQVETALEAGIDVTHLDSHMGTTFAPAILPAWTALAREFGLPTFIPAEWRGRPAIDAMEAGGVPVIDVLVHATYGPDHSAKSIMFDAVFSTLQPGFTHVLIHPAHDTPELHAEILDPGTRIADYSHFAGGSRAAALREAGVTLTGYRELRDAIRANRFTPPT